ncbi:hypothetical protein DM02DRAFT_647095 [Periconia macrospinosa]|uniref:Uncharacterized protein n=1 Tax=Periconia macrospinosa TaxID=97972 RepID=A0A2V1D224_9PLEO|nr:hypothetical protein DM02DRAFT_647095 [Periconia macrospinosa]
MHLSKIFFSVLAVTSAVYAAPTPLDLSRTPAELEARTPPKLQVKKINNFPPGNWKCKTSQIKDTTKTFSSDYIKRSVEYSLKLRDNGNKKAGDSKYPNFFTEPASIPGLEKYRGKDNINHFPLNFDDETVFTRGKPKSGARVVYEHMIDDDKATFLGVWTHAGRNDKSSEKCEKVD